MAGSLGDQSAPWPTNRALAIAVTATIVALAYGNGINLLPEDQRDNPKLLANVFVTLLVLAIAAGARLRRDELGIEPKGARSGLWGLAFGVLAAIPPMLFIMVAPLITGESVSDDDIERQTLAGVLWRVGVRVLIGTAIPEEIIFRGLLFALWRRAGGTGAAVIATSIAFGLWHAVISFGSVSSGGAGDHAAIVGIAYAATLVGLTAGGLLLAVMRWRTGSIAAPAVFHWTFNGLLIVTAWLRA